MTEEWVSLWYQCLAQNIDYSRYCDARASGAEAECHSYERRFPCVREIYEDFGELDGWPDDGMASAGWKNWFLPRQHLFISKVTEVTGPALQHAAAGHVLIDVPLYSDKERTAAALAAFLDDYYARQPVTVCLPPKYSLLTKGDGPAHGLQRVRHACLSAARSYRYDPATYEERPFNVAVSECIRHEIDNFGWKLDPVARRDLIENGSLSEQRLDSFKAMLTRCRRDFRAFARNTIRGRFPDDAPFESEVLDRF